MSQKPPKLPVIGHDQSLILSTQNSRELTKDDEGKGIADEELADRSESHEEAALETRVVSGMKAVVQVLLTKKKYAPMSEEPLPGPAPRLRRVRM